MFAWLLKNYKKNTNINIETTTKETKASWQISFSSILADDWTISDIRSRNPRLHGNSASCFGKNFSNCKWRHHWRHRHFLLGNILAARQRHWRLRYILSVREPTFYQNKIITWHKTLKCFKLAFSYKHTFCFE